MHPVIVALDVESGSRALALAELLHGTVGAFKIGSRLFTLEGPDLVRRLVDAGERVFLDLKFHDIPNTVAHAVESAVTTGAWMVNVHASGGIPMMQAGARAGREAAAKLGRPAPLLIAVTVLTSMDAPTLASVGVTRRTPGWTAWWRHRWKQRRSATPAGRGLSSSRPASAAPRRARGRTTSIGR